MIFRAAVVGVCALWSAVVAAEPDYSLILVGGGLKSCSSVSLQGCVAGTQAPAGALQQQLFQFSALSPSVLGEQHAAFLALLVELSRAHADQRFSERELLRLIRAAKVTHQGAQLQGKDLWLALSSAQQDTVLQFLQSPMLQNNVRLTEVAMPQQLQNKHTLAIYQEIVAQARKAGGQAKPRIVILTASSRDPFAAVDYYRSLFNSLGAQSSWLAINPLWQRQQAQGAAACAQLSQAYASELHNYRREVVYPDLFDQQRQLCEQGHSGAVQVLQQADAVFFNGGDQSLTYLALKQPDGTDTPELAAIRQKYAAQQLVIAGTSAGTAVQTGLPHAMISGGDSETAFAQAAYLKPLWACDNDCPAATRLSAQPSSGLGFFPYGILDTHFSERGRQGRLMQLVSQTAGTLGVGIDENTALLVKPSAQGASMRVLGEGGVFVAQAGPLPTVWRTHYLTHDDQVQVTVKDTKPHLQFQLAAWKYTDSRRNQMLMQTNDVFAGDRYRALASLLCHNQNQQAIGKFEVAGKPWQLLMKRTSQTTSRTGVYQRDGQLLAVCSYHDLTVSYQELHD